MTDFNVLEVRTGDKNLYITYKFLINSVWRVLFALI